MDEQDKAEIEHGNDLKTILESFEQCYHANILKLPKVMMPKTTHHGKHSYTVSVPDNAGKMHRVEVLLRQNAFKPKMDGVKSGSCLGLQITRNLVLTCVLCMEEPFFASCCQGFPGRASPWRMPLRR